MRKEKTMKKIWMKKPRAKGAWIVAPFGAGIGVGAALMYLLDPERGKRRRALAKDKLVHATHVTAQEADVTSRNAVNHVRGVIARIRSRVKSEHVPDSVLAERVRARIGHLVPHAGSIDVTVRDGRATLAGPALGSELDALLADLARVRGIVGIDNRLGLPEETRATSDTPVEAALPAAAPPAERRRKPDVATVS
jgi:hypothetical protein